MSSPRQPLQQFPINIQGYTPARNDYSQLDPVTGAAMVEVQGARPEQEDQLRVIDLPGYNALPPYRVLALQRHLFKLMQLPFNDPTKTNCGSTALAATAWITDDNFLNAHTAHVGDCEAYVVVIGQNNQVRICRRLNSNLHNPGKNPAERQRLLDQNRLHQSLYSGIRVKDKFGNPALAVSRAIGDPTILDRDSDHVPQIDQEPSIKLEENEQAFLVAACDGLYDNISDEEKIEMISQVVLANRYSPVNAAHELINRALITNRSTDNISVAVAPILRGRPPVSAAVFDGHGGTQVSSYLGKYFYPALKAMLNMYNIMLQRRPEGLRDTRLNQPQILPIPKAQPSSAKKVQLFIDFDGTLTSACGQDVFTSGIGDFYSEVTDRGMRAAATNMLLDAVPYFRVRLSAVGCLRQMAANPNVEVNLVSRNYEDYIVTALRHSGLGDDVINQINIYDRTRFYDKSEVINNRLNTKAKSVFVLDDDENDRESMVRAVENKVSNKNSLTAPQFTVGAMDWNKLSTQVEQQTREIRIHSDTKKTQVQQQGRGVGIPPETNRAQVDQQTPEIGIPSKTKKGFLSKLEKDMKREDLTAEQILDLFEQLKKKNGEYAAIHKQRNPKFDRFRLFFKCNKNAGEHNFWHTDTYQKAVKIVKNAYLKVQHKNNVPANEESARGRALINYVRGNAAIHKTHTSSYNRRFKR